MIRTECCRLIKYLFANGKIDEEKREKCLKYINRESVHTEIRNLIMLILLPKKLHIDGTHQAAFLRAAVSRVRNFDIINLGFNLLFQIANQTVLEEQGLFFLRPVYQLLFEIGLSGFLELLRPSVSVFYKIYNNTYKDGIQVGPDGLSLHDAVEKGLTPGKTLRVHWSILLHYFI